MEESQARSCFAALSQETRLAVIRLLVRAGMEGVSAGTIAEKLGVSASNLSFHLKELERAELIVQRRAARSIFYAANYDGLRSLIGFLMKDCCASKPEILDTVLQEASCGPASKSRVCA